jgi:diaminohydroxyphosphoribosylaminopyrimidine deaminase/5-amino-6-(5-phosphoribosylamino)uracil reductase
MEDSYFMELALKEAYRAKGRTLPNPAVGAVVVKDGKVISTGFHQRAGMAHAERVALDRAGALARGATLYVTLEPCNHYGKTPPCTEKIIASGIKRVVVGVRDPNPVARGGIERLVKAGIEVKVGVLKEKCFELIEDFLVNLKFNRPFLSLKLASTLDGATADKKGSSKWITSQESRKLVHLLRSYHNSVMVGIGTVLSDDPLLTVRLVPSDFQPRPIVVDPSLKIPTNCRLVKERASELIVVTAQESLLSYKAGILTDLGVKLVPVFNLGKELDLKEALDVLRKEFGLYSILCEGGAKLSYSLLDRGLIDKFYLFYAPKVLGGKDFYPLFFGESRELQNAYRFKLFSVEKVGEDAFLKMYSPELGALLKEI